MTQQDKKQSLYKKISALRMEVDGSIVDDIKQAVDALFAPNEVKGVDEFPLFTGDKTIGSEWIIISAEHGHKFEIGDKIRIVSVNETDYYATNGKESWYVRDNELAPAPPKKVEASLALSHAVLEDFIEWLADNYERERKEFRSDLWFKNEDASEHTTKEVVDQFIQTKLAQMGE